MSFSNTFHFVETESLTEPGAGRFGQADWPSESREPLLSSSPVLGLRASIANSLCGYRRLNSGSHAYTVSSLPSRLSPQCPVLPAKPEELHFSSLKKKKRTFKLGVVAHAFNPQHSGSRGRQISVSSRPAWSTQPVPGQPVLKYAQCIDALHLEMKSQAHFLVSQRRLTFQNERKGFLGTSQFCSQFNESDGCLS